MSTTFLSDAVAMSAAESQPVMANLAVQMEVEFVKCDCCGLTEECTHAYIQRIRERYQGKWICGLCGEAVKDEIVRSERLISTEEAMTRHMSFCSKSKTAGPPPNPTVHLMRQILRRSLESPRKARSMPGSPTKNTSLCTRLGRSGSCIPNMSMDSSSSSSFNDLEDVEKLTMNSSAS